MITLSDCEAFCDADPGWVRELARREQLGMVQAYAQAHEMMTGAAVPVVPTRPLPSGDGQPGFRRAA